MIAKGERLGELRGKRGKTFDSQGLHPYSFIVGTIGAYQNLVPELLYADFMPVLFRREAHRAADQEFREEILNAGA